MYIQIYDDDVIYGNGNIKNTTGTFFVRRFFFNITYMPVTQGEGACLCVYVCVRLCRHAWLKIKFFFTAFNFTFTCHIFSPPFAHFFARLFHHLVNFFFIFFHRICLGLRFAFFTFVFYDSQKQKNTNNVLYSSSHCK